MAENPKIGTNGKVCSGPTDSNLKADIQVSGDNGSEESDRLDEVAEDAVPDGGYGWVIVFGCFLAHILFGGLERSDGVFYLQFKHRYHQSAQIIGWMLGVVSSIRLMFGPLASSFCNHFSARLSCMIGASLMTTACVLTAYTPNFWYMFFSHTALQGFGRGFMYAPCLIIVGDYFHKKRGLAAGLGSSGTGVGTFALVPLSQILFDHYGFTGAFLILGGIAANTFVVAMLFRPLSLHNKFLRARRQISRRPTEADKHVSLSEMQDTEDKYLQIKPSFDNNLSVYSTKPLISSAKNGTRDCPGHPLSQSGTDAGDDKQPKREGCLRSMCCPAENRQKGGKSNKKLFHFYLLKDASFLFFCISIALFSAAFKAAFTFIPALVEQKGLSDTDASLILSIAGILDTLGRIGAGFILDLSSIKPMRPVIYNMLIFAIAVVSCLLPSLNTFAAFSVLCGIYGTLTGAYISQKSVVIVDILGPEHMASSFGILILFQGMGTCIGPPLSGALKDAFGGFDEAFYVGGGSMVFAGLLMVLGNCFLHHKRKRKQPSRDTELIS